MKKLLLLSITFFVFGKLSAQSVPNGGFENWNVNAWGNPTNYSTSNDAIFQNVPNPAANVVEVTGWTSGVKGAQLSTVVIDGDTFPGFMTNSINNPLKGQGGIPYNQKPTGIEIWYNCNEMPGDSGLFGVIFKKAGFVIGAYLYRVTGTVGTPTNLPLLTETFSPALPFTPDSVIFAATSSSDILQNKKGFPGSTFTVSGVTFLGNGITNPTLMNGDFTSWTPGDTIITPAGWIAASFPGYFRTTDAYAGNYALKLTTKAIDEGNGNFGISPESVSTAKNPFDPTSFQYPYSTPADTFEFYYKYTSAVSSSDSGGVTLLFHTALADVGSTTSLPPTTGGYQLEKIPTDLIIYPGLDSVIVKFVSWYSAISSSHVMLADSGSTLEVDNAEFQSQQIATGLKPILLADNTILIYPNPAVTQFTIASAESSINEIRLQNILGETVLDNLYSQGNATTRQIINVNNLTPGLYFISITSGNKTSTGKITVSR